MAAFDRLLKMLSHGAPYLGGSIPCGSHSGDRPERIEPYVRVVAQLEGELHYAISVGGNRRDITLAPGQCLYLAPNAWSVEFWNETGWVFAFSVLPRWLRLIHLIHPEGTPRNLPGSPWAYHTALPLHGAALLAARSLNLLAEEGDPAAAARDQLLALLRLCRQHLLEDQPRQSAHGRAQATWWAAHLYMQEHFNEPITRRHIAQELRVHPTYLSILARQISGQSFREVLEGIRMLHGQRLMRETDLKLHRIAQLCGYSDAANFSKAFRRATGVTPGQFRIGNSFPR